ncbi:MAG: polyprenyl diphosphate synthase [Pseudomonadota bacterium]
MTNQDLHIAIIMDGNGRWAQRRGKPRTAGHREGAKAARKVVEHAARAGLGTLSLYAFSSDNWSRPGTEVRSLMALLARYLASETARCLQNDIRLTVIGRRDRLSASLLRAIDGAERQTRDCQGMHLRVAVDYSSTHAIATAAAAAKSTDDPVSAFNTALAQAIHCPAPGVAVDLLVRSGGEQRLSDFLLWECAYAELHFSPVLWPDFKPADLEEALQNFAARQRRYGGVPEARTATAGGGHTS